jgi:twitching motility protein PilT
VSQREVGKDALSFASGLKAMLREDPDVILVGEMRDLETISLALTAAETGHLVFGTLHTNGAPNTVNRILDVFPPAQQAQARSQLSQSLRLVVTQRLLPRADVKGRIAAFEVMVCNNAIANLIRESKIHQIVQVMQTGRALGMTTMADYLDGLLKQGKIRKEDI